MELVKDVVVDFCLFSLIEGFIFCLFFEKIGGCKKFKWYEVLILSIGNCIISQVFPPVLYQIIILFYMSIAISAFDKKYNIRYYFKIVFLSIVFMLVVEMNFGIIFELIFKENFISISLFYSFLISLFLRILEIFFIFKGEKIMKIWWGEVRK